MMMTGEHGKEEYLRESSGGGGGDWMSLLRTLERDEILQVLSNGFCQCCQVVLEDRIHSFINKKVDEVSFSSDNHTRYTQKISYPSTQRGHRGNSFEHSGSQRSLNGNSSSIHDGLSEDPNEHNRLSEVRRKKDFIHIENISGRATNVLLGLELHTRVFNSGEQKKIVECIYSLQRMGQKGQLRERTYTEPRKWMRGKGRVTIQFGCCYNYVVDKNRNPPGIVRDEEVDVLPPLFKQMIRRMVKWHVLPPTCIPDSCIVNIYDEGDCIPPHIDHHDFIRPFCTVSLLAECNILFGSNLKIVGPGEFSGPVSIPLPLGSVLILNGNAADIAKHCVPGVRARRISITFRKMDNSKQPYHYFPDPELQGIKPVACSPFAKSQVQQEQQEKPYSFSPFNSQVQKNFHQRDKFDCAR